MAIKVGGIEVVDNSRNVVNVGTVDGRDVAADGTKLDGIEAGATADQTPSELLTAIKTVDGAGSGLDADTLDGKQLSTIESEYQAYATTAVANVIDAAPATLDTLNELAAALGDDPNFATTVTNSIATKLPLSGGTMTGDITFNSTQLFDGRDVSADGSKLDGIEAGADVTDAGNVNPLVDSHLNTSTATSGDALLWNGSDYSWGAAGISNVVEDTTPQLGGNLDIQTNSITSTSDRIKIEPTAFSGKITLTNSLAYSVIMESEQDPKITLHTAGQTGTIEINPLGGPKPLISSTDDLEIEANNGVYLSHNNATKLETTTSGVTVTGTATANVFVADSSALSGTTPSVDVSASDTYTLTTSGNTTFTFTGAPSSGQVGTFSLIITAGGTHTLTWPASVDWAGGTAPDAPASGEKDVYTFITVDGGTTWYGFLAGDAMA